MTDEEIYEEYIKCQELYVAYLKQLAEHPQQIAKGRQARQAWVDAMEAITWTQSDIRRILRARVDSKLHEQKVRRRR